MLLISLPRPLFTFFTLAGFLISLLVLCTGSGFLVSVGLFLLLALRLAFVSGFLFL